jgi:hypothetical protein
MRSVVMGLAGLLAWSGVTSATDVTFSGTLLGVCQLAVPTPGVLVLAADGTLTSSSGTPAVLSLLSVGANTVTVTAPSWVTLPVDYVQTGESLSVSYTGAGGLGVINQAYTTSQTSFPVDTLPLTPLTINAKATNTTSGFPAGTYQMKVVVTCS